MKNKYIELLVIFGIFFVGVICNFAQNSTQISLDYMYFVPWLNSMLIILVILPFLGIIYYRIKSKKDLGIKLIKTYQIILWILFAVSVFFTIGIWNINNLWVDFNMEITTIFKGILWSIWHSFTIYFIETLAGLLPYLIILILIIILIRINKKRIILNK